MDVLKCPSTWWNKAYEMGSEFSYYVKRSLYGPKSSGAVPSGQFSASMGDRQKGGKSFIIIGDWGSHASQRAREKRAVVRDNMVGWAETNRPSFVLSTGDNFYPTGITNVLDPKIQRDWNNFYSMGWLSDIQWYISVGNHDHDGNVSAQVELSKKEPRWIFPNTWYDFDHVFDGGVTIHFVIIDTMLLIDDWHTEIYRRGGCNENMLKLKQIVFMKESLKASKADWNIVVGHHPIYTGGMHGWIDEERDVMKSVINPILDEFGVDVYFCGHDHNLQYITDANTPNLHYILSGSGSGENYCKYDRYEAQLKKRGKEIVSFVDKPGFVSMTVTKHSLAFAFHVMGEIVFDRTVTRNNQYTRKQPSGLLTSPNTLQVKDCSCEIYDEIINKHETKVDPLEWEESDSNVSQPRLEL